MGYVIRHLTACVVVRLGRQRSPKNRSDKYPTKYLRAANLIEDGFDLSDFKDMDFKPNEFETYKLRKGDVLLSEGPGTVEPSNRTLGTCAVWDDRLPNCCIENTIIRVRSDHIPPRYVFHILTYARYNGDFARIAKGIGIAHLGAERLTSYPIPIAPRDEINRIVEKIDYLLQIADTIERTAEKARSALAQLEQATLRRAFCRELEKQDSSDEIASILLERIRVERNLLRKSSRTKQEIAIPAAISGSA